MSDSILPESVSGSNQWKTFWTRREAWGGAFLLLAAAGLGIYAWGTISSFLVAMLVDTVHIAELTALLTGMGWVVFSKRSHMLFRLLSRWLTGLIINVDPIGILEDKVQQMRKRREKLAEQISNVSGQKRYLQDIIDKNSKDAQQNMAYAEQAKKMAAAATNSEKKMQMEFQVKAKANQAGRLQASNESYQLLLGKVTMVYDLLSKWAINIDFFIEDTANTVKEKKIQYKTLNTATGAVSMAMQLIKGNADENDLYDRTMEHLVEVAGQKMGEIEDFQHVAQNFMDSMDIQNGAIDAKALAELDKYEQKLLSSGDAKTAFLLPDAAPQTAPEPIRVKRAIDARPGSDDYKDLVK